MVIALRQARTPYREGAVATDKFAPQCPLAGAGLRKPVTKLLSLLPTGEGKRSDEIYLHAARAEFVLPLF